MTNYEKLIKEARALEGMYYKGEKIVQSVGVLHGGNGCSVLLMDIKDDPIFHSMYHYDFSDVIEELENFKNQCYTRLEEVVVVSVTSEDAHSKHQDQLNAAYFLKSISDIEINYTDCEECITPLKILKKEIKQILNEDN